MTQKAWKRWEKNGKEKSKQGGDGKMSRGKKNTPEIHLKKWRMKGEET